ncbi:MAG: trypsin-like serine protease [Deinococcota bacterium]
MMKQPQPYTHNVSWLATVSVLLLLVLITACGDSGGGTTEPITLADVNGQVWQDDNDNGLRDAGEDALEGVRVYWDRNENGAFDSGEPNRLTTADGRYSFRFEAGTYRLAIEPPSGSLQTLPRAGESLTSGSTSRTANKVIDNKVIGGEVSSVDEFPFAAALVPASAANARVNIFCTASLVRPQWLITAAHCLLDGNGEPITDVAGVEAVLGRTTLLSEAGERIPASELIFFPNFVNRFNPFWLNDVMLIRLERPSSQATVRLLSPPLSNLADVGTTATMAGWGNTNLRLDSGDPEELANDLQAALQPIDDLPECIRILDLILEQSPTETARPDLDPAAVLCSGFATPTNNPDFASSSAGDSGGPLLVQDAGDSYYLAGVTSFGADTSYDFRAYIPSYADWIETTIGERDPGHYTLTVADNALDNINFGIRTANIVDDPSGLAFVAR